MNFSYRKRAQGFTVIELMIVLIVVAILVSLAYPSYVNYVRKARRGEAMQLLINWSVNQEIWRSNNALYATVAQLPAPTHANYTFSLAAPSPPTATVFTLQAVASGDQANDKTKNGTACSTLNINSAGQKYSAGNTATTLCWE